MKFKWTTVSIRMRGLGGHTSHSCVMLNPPRPPVEVGSLSKDDHDLWTVRVANHPDKEPWLMPGPVKELRELVQDEWTRNFMEQ